MYYVIQCRFSELLFQLCIKNAFFLGPCRNITTMCRKIAFFLGPCRNITIQGHQGQGVPGVPCRAIFSGREEILIFGEIFTSESHTSTGPPRFWGRLEEEEWRGGNPLDDSSQVFAEQVWLCQCGAGEKPGSPLSPFCGSRRPLGSDPQCQRL